MNLAVFPEKAAGGVGTVIANLRRLLDNHRFTGENEADLIISHVGARRSKEVDILWTHGLYPTGQPGWNGQHEAVNRAIFQAAAEALEVVAVSDWGARSILRYTGRRATVIPNGIFWHDWKNVADPNGFVLWPKIGSNPTVNPEPFMRLSTAPYQFMAFFKAKNIVQIKPFPHERLMELFSRTAVLVSITKENDSVMIMEAMASGVPVLALRNGIFTSSKYHHKEGCYIAEREEELRSGLDWLMKHHREQSEWARVYSGYFDMEKLRPLVEGMLERTLERKSHMNRVTIVIPNRDYEKYLGTAIDSALVQTHPCEVIVVDDASTDDSLKVVQGRGVQLIANATRRGVAEARNQGIEKANGNLILCLDADDALEPDAVERMLAGFKDRRTAVVFGPVTFCDEKLKRLGEFFVKPAKAVLQQSGANQVPTMAMFRKEWWERVGGYDTEMEYCEDAQLWLKMFQLDGKAGFIDAIIARYRGHAEGHFKTQIVKPRWNRRFDRKVRELDLPVLTVVLPTLDDMSLIRTSFRIDEELPEAHLSDLRERPERNFILYHPNMEIPEWIRQS